MNKMMRPEKLLAAISFVPESAPFSEDQRAWLNGFFAGMTGIQEINSDSDLDAFVGNITDVAEPEPVEDFPWKDESLTIDDRLNLAEGRPLKRQLMAAMAQLDCGSCGYVCQTYSEAIADGLETNLTLCSPGGKETNRALKKLVRLTGDLTAQKSTDGSKKTNEASVSAYSRNNPFSAKLIRSEKITSEGSAKDVRHVEIDLTGSGIQYRVGDALGIFPTNCGSLIEGTLGLCHTNGSIDQTRAALQTLNLSAVTDELIDAMAHELTDENEKQRLAELAKNDEALDTLDVLDFLTLFPAAKIPDTTLVASLPPLNPRLYSIASSLKAHTDQVHLTVGKVTYEHNQRMRKGVASTMLAERAEVGCELNIFIQPSHGFTIPEDPSAAMIMVGPGTGIAPFVSFLQERAATKATGKNWLFFGDQRSQTDFLYRDTLESYVRQGVLTRLDTAFSRDQEKKIYVQDRMRDNGAELFAWLNNGASFYVCGDASRMANDVDRTLHEIVAEHGTMTSSAAKEFVQNLKNESRYCRDVY